MIHGDLIEKDESINLALNKPSIASSEYNQYSKSTLAFDGSFKNNGGNDQSRWTSTRKSNDEYIQVDLGDIYEINNIKLYWEGQGASQYKILISNDGENYTEAYVENNGQPGILDLQFDQSIAARYVKMQGVTCASDYGYSLWEFEIYGKDYKINDGLQNVAIYQSAAASTVDNQAIPARAVDGNKTTSFKSQMENNPWLSIFMKDIYTVSRAKISFVNNNVEAFVIESSLDGENWDIVKSVTLKENLSPLYLDFDEAIDSKYMRIRVLDETKRVLEIKEFEVYGKLNESLEEINLALYKTSSASSEYDNTKGFIFESKYAFDGSIESRGDAYQSRWVSQRESNNEWIYVNLGDYYYLSRVILNWENAYAKEYKIQVSIDAQNWTDLTHVQNGVAGVKEFIYNDQPQAKYVRMLGIEATTKYGYSLWEFEVYGMSIRSELKALYDDNSNLDTSLYTPNSIEIYQSALKNAIVVYQNDESTVKDITDAMKMINDALDGLHKKADKTNLQGLLNQVKQLEESVYTEDSYKQVIDVCNQVKIIFDDANASQTSVNDAYDQLRVVLDNLERKPTNPEEPTDPEDPTNPEGPTDPEGPTNPGNPTDPANPTNPTDPIIIPDPTKSGVDKVNKDTTVSTNDNSQIVTFALLAISVLVIAIVSLNKPKRKVKR